jgi:hypothetical protein
MQRSGEAALKPDNRIIKPLVFIISVAMMVDSTDTSRVLYVVVLGYEAE